MPRTMIAQCIQTGLDLPQMQFWFETEGLLEAQGTLECIYRLLSSSFVPCALSIVRLCE